MNLKSWARRALGVVAVATSLAGAGQAHADSIVPIHSPRSGNVVATAVVATAPRSPTATPGNAIVKLAWLAPASNGGAKIDGYRVQRATSAKGPWKTIATPIVRRYRASGLANGKRYYFRVAAHNAAGWSTPSKVISAVPRWAPTAPRSPVATPGNATVKLTWLTPANNGGARIDRYRVQRATASGGPWTTVARPTTRSYTATGLANGTRYYFRVAAHNALGWGTHSTVVNAVPRSKPTAPRSPTATPGNTTVKLTWLAPSSTGGAKVDQYRVERAMSAGGQWETVANPTTRSFTAGGLANGTRYYFRVAAHNALGWSTPSTVVNAVPRGVPAEPWLKTVTPGNGTVALTWDAPSYNGGAAIEHYIVQQAPNAGGPWHPIANPTGLSYTATDLNGGTTYYFRIAAHNAAGDSAPSAVGSATTPVTKPSAPAACNVSQVNGPGSHTARIKWGPPTNDGGTPITGYSVFLVHVESNSVAYLNLFIDESITEVPATNLPFGHFYAEVYAANQQGLGPECQSPVIVMQP